MARKLIHKTYRVTSNFCSKLEELLILAKENENSEIYNIATLLDDMINHYYSIKKYGYNDSEFAPVTDLYVKDTLSQYTEITAEFHNAMLSKIEERFNLLESKLDEITEDVTIYDEI